jgi:regulator of extracellular matrix RemA (YlzA/DUF370 family)
MYNRLQAKTYTLEIKMLIVMLISDVYISVVQPKHVADNLNKIVKNYWNRVVLDGNPWTWVTSVHPLWRQR